MSISPKIIIRVGYSDKNTKKFDRQSPDQLKYIEL